MHRNTFLPIFIFPTIPSKLSQKTNVCINEGAIKANVEDATAPISEMNRSIFGIASLNNNNNNNQALREASELTIVNHGYLFMKPWLNMLLNGRSQSEIFK